MDEEILTQLDEKKLLEIKELLSNASIEVDKNDMKALARYFVQLKSLEDSFGKIIKDIEKVLVENKVNIQFSDMMRKVAYSEPHDLTYIDGEGLAELLMSVNRMQDFIKVATVTESKLKLIEGGTNLIERFKKVGGKTKPSVHVRDMTKEEVKTSEKKKTRIKLELKRRS